MEKTKFITIALMASALILMILAYPMFKKKVSPNGFYGFRTKKTLSDKKIWYEANKIAGRDLIIASILILIILPILFFYGSQFFSKDTLNLVSTIVFTLIVLLATFHSWIKVKNL